MKSKLISIGDEILIGQIVNTNASYLGERLYSAGVPVEKIVVIGDEESMLISELEDALNNYDVTIITGGLGPTHDDITKPVLVRFFNDELVKDEKVLEHVKKIFSDRKIEMPEINVEQAMVPKNSKVIWNELGTAPGILFERNGRIIMSLPGVPYEMKAMMENFILPYLESNLLKENKIFLKQKTLLTTGLGESSLFEKIGDIKSVIGEAKLAFLPSAEGVRLRINVKGERETETQKQLNEIEIKLREKIGKFIYGVNEDSLEKVIGKILRDMKKTLSVAESCTGGMISQKLVSIPGSSDYYLGGVCSYSNKEKINILGVKEETLKKYGAVSEATAIEMAEGVRKLTKSDYSISTTGIAGPDGGFPEKPVGLVWIGYSDSEISFAIDFSFGSNREINIRRASMRALEILRRKLLKTDLNFK
ncbi:MAG: Nicotinamide-nucleotide amidohydrolase PncC [Ignavibacteria bacterium]|nr:Nicotinamide-nucleotide amidohydrolase PncC [Ignavibacteria bacterium]